MADESVRAKMASATRRIARLKRIDRAAVFVITLGGLSVVVGVLGILVFIAAEAHADVPVGAALTAKPPVSLAAPAASDPRLRARRRRRVPQLPVHRRT